MLGKYVAPFAASMAFMLAWGQENAGGLRPSSLVESEQTQAARPVLTPEMRGDIYMARKMYREALDMYKQVPDSAILANKAGIAYHQMTMLNEAKKQYQRALKLQPRYSEAVNNLGTVHYAQRNFRRAISQYRKALKLNPTSASVYSNLGTAHFARKKYKQAAEAYQQALALDPDVFEHRGNQGVLLQERNIEERAKFYFYLAKTYAKTGHLERTLLYMRKALEQGFKEREKFLSEPEFAAFQNIPEFIEITKAVVRVL